MPDCGASVYRLVEVPMQASPFRSTGDLVKLCNLKNRVTSPRNIVNMCTLIVNHDSFHTIIVQRASRYIDKS